MAAEPTTGYAPVNGTNVYWESRGAEGTPLLRSGRCQGTAARR